MIPRIPPLPSIGHAVPMWKVTAIILGFIVAGQFTLLSRHISPPMPQLIAIDGDTVRDTTNKVTYRLLGFDAPETWRAQCDAERVKGEQAKAWLQYAIAQATRIDLAPIGARDKYGRSLAHLRIDGVDVGQNLIGLKLAHIYAGGHRKSWCD